MIIRSEEEKDYKIIGKIHTLAFGHDLEAKLIEDLRSDEKFDKDLSLVAEENGNVIGHILFSHITIETPVSSKEAVILAPLAVLKDYRNKKAGTELVLEGIKRTKERGYKIMLVYGHTFYERFGFKLAHENHIFRPNPMPGEIVRILEMEKGAACGVSGVIKYPGAFKPLVNQWYT